MPPFDRRRSPRARLATRATLLVTGEPLGSFDVLNLAAGGIALQGVRPAELGALVDVVLPLGSAEPVVIQSRILRERPTLAGPSFVLTFEAPSPATQALLEKTIALALAAASTASVLVVDDSREIGLALELQLGCLGHAAHAVTTPLEALRVLAAPNRIEVAIIDHVLGAADGLDLLAFLAERHPYVRRVLMSGHAHPNQLGQVLRQRPEAAPHEVIGKPWSESTLVQAVRA